MLIAAQDHELTKTSLLIHGLVLVQRLPELVSLHFERIGVHRGDRALQREIAAVLVGMHRRPEFDAGGEDGLGMPAERRSARDKCQLIQSIDYE